VKEPLDTLAKALPEKGSRPFEGMRLDATAANGESSV
jgi:hypothetical protein